MVKQKYKPGKLEGRFRLFLAISGWLFTQFSCTNKQEENPSLFEVLESKQTGLDFENKLTPTAEFNLFKYLYFYNGAGVGTGDFNKDGLIDLFFSSNQGQNKLYLNKGNLEFKDVTVPAKIPQDGGWSTGVSVVDINNDGFLDIYVCRVGNYDLLQGKNQFLVCKGIDANGIPFYEDKASQMGLDFSGFSTQAAFLDYDMDGDLDMYLMNHSLRFSGTFNERKSYYNTYDTLAGDYFFRNDSPFMEEGQGEVKFTDVTKSTGILGFIIGYGLGIAVSDINLDGWPDIYIGNDFHENDYLYINQKNSTFKDVLQDEIMHTSQFSMGVDVADINNDALPEIISLDMMPEDPNILKRSLGEDEYNLWQFKVRHGYHPQFARNNLQLNRGNGMFSEIGIYSNVFATDWSWASLFMDFDNDGWKDLFVSNGIPKRMNDFDYINYVSSAEVQEKARNNNLKEQDLALIEKFPQIKLKNKFYLNKKEARFEDVHSQIENDQPTFSNGAAYADFDNDGDLDIVVNNINDPVLLYKNKAIDKAGKNFYLELKLKGPPRNINATGAKAIVFTSGEMKTFEKFPVRGFQGSMEIPLHIGLGRNKADSILLIWPDNTFEKLGWLTDTIYTVYHKPGLPKFDYSKLSGHFPKFTKSVTDITAQVNLNYLHKENSFNEFDREPLIPFMVSREGPALAIGDVNGDGLEDVFAGAAKFEKAALFLQRSTGKFTRSYQPALDADSTYEDTDACWTDVNNDSHLDLIVASGGNEYFGNSEYLKPRVYINDGQGNLSRKRDAFQNILLTASCVLPYDFTGDGFVDLFIGGRAVSWEYGKIPASFLLTNNGSGKFIDVTADFSKELKQIGLVKDADWSDMDKDGDKDLVIALEWGELIAFKNEKGSFEKKVLTGEKGWWNFTLPVDLDGDGDMDLLAGNAGLNNRLKASIQKPVRLYYNDFDENGKKEQIVTYYLDNKEIPIASKEELQKQIPGMKKKYLYAEDFAKATLTELFGTVKLEKAGVFTATYFSNAVLINEGNWKFTIKELPWEAQFTSYRDAIVFSADKDDKPDILLGGNFYANNIQLGKFDADYGTVLINKGNGDFICQSLNGLVIKGEIRRIRKINKGEREMFILARNNDSLKVIQFK